MANTQINYLDIQLHYSYTSHLVSVYIRDPNIIREGVVVCHLSFKEALQRRNR
jgi:hypothetical protein